MSRVLLLITCIFYMTTTLIYGAEVQLKVMPLINQPDTIGFIIENVGEAAIQSYPLGYIDNVLDVTLPNGQKWVNPMSKTVLPIILQKGARHMYTLNIADFVKYRSGLKNKDKFGEYRFKWVVNEKFESNELLIRYTQNPQAVITNSTDIYTVVDPKDKSAKAVLAYVFNEKQPPELAFIVLNGTDKKLDAAEPLTEKSCVTVSVPALKYSRELTLPDAEKKTFAVEPGKSAVKRIAWQTVVDLLPKEDLVKIEAAGGELELTWKAGDLVSPPLPLSLAKPAAEGEQAGKKAAEPPLTLTCAMVVAAGAPKMAFILKNSTKQVFTTTPLATNHNTVIIQLPDGKIIEHTAWKDGIKPVEVQTGGEFRWDLDLNEVFQLYALKTGGLYQVYWKIDEIESNKIPFVIAESEKPAASKSSPEK